MKHSSFFNSVSGGFIGAAIALYALPSFVDDFKTAFHKAQAEQRAKPQSDIMPRIDAPGTLTVYSFADNALAFSVYRNAEGKMDRDGRPALTVTMQHFDVLVFEGWYKNGRLHRLDGPALVEYDPLTGKVTCEDWYLDGEPTGVLQRVSAGTQCQIPVGPAPKFQPL